MLEKIISENNLTKVGKIAAAKTSIYYGMRFIKQPLKMELLYQKATKATNFGSKPVEPKTNCCHETFFYDPSKVKHISQWITFFALKTV